MEAVQLTSVDFFHESNNMKPDPYSLRIIAHHIGARGFGVSLNLPEAFRSEVVNVLYEADSDAVARMSCETDSPQAKLLAEKYVLPYAVGRKKSKAVLNITANSYASSLFQPNPDFSRYYCEIPIDAAIYDVTYREMLEVVRKVELEVHSIDELFAAGKIPVAAAPDFLSIDTQGYELEILHGAEEAIKKGVLGIVCEVEMIPMYQEQPLLGDILNFASANGFLFAGFTAMFEVSPFRGPIGARGKGLPGFGDALFFKDIGALVQENTVSAERYGKLLKLAFIAISYGYIEYGLAALAAAEEVRGNVDATILREFGKQKIVRFLGEVEAAVQKLDPLFPPIHAVPDDARSPGDNRTSWYNKHHVAALDHFHKLTATAASANPVGAPALTGQVGLSAATQAPSLAKSMRSRLGGIARRYLPPRIVGILRRATAPTPETAAFTAPSTVSPTAPIVDHGTTGTLSSAPHPWSSIAMYSAVEKVLEDWGFGGPAYLVRTKRMAVERYVRSLDSSKYKDGALAHIPLSD